MAGPSPPWPGKRTSSYTLFVLTVVVMFTVLDRQVLALMIEPVKADFGISDTQVALLLGAAFSIPYGVAGLLIARLADKWNRRNIVAISIAFWSAATMACGITQSYMQLLCARIALGIGESGYGPATWSMVTDSFPREKVAFGTATLSIGALTGTGLALMVGGGALAFVSHFPAVDIPFIGPMRPWQWAFVIVGAPALVWTLFVLSLQEPARRGFVKGQKEVASVTDVMRFMSDDARTYGAVIGGLAMKYLMLLGTSQWMPTLFRREFKWELSQIGILLGALTLVLSPLGLICGGKLAERWAKQGRADANLRVAFYGLCISVPLFVVVPLIPDPWLMLTVYGVFMFVGSLGTGPSVAAFQVITPNRMRAQVSSVSQFSTNVVAFMIGPLVVALFTDYLFSDPQDLKYSMSLCSAIMGPLTILLVMQGLKPYARSYERAVREFAN